MAWRCATGALLLLGWGERTLGDARILFEPDGRPICTGRADQRTVVGVVPDGEGGHLAVTVDPWADLQLGSDGGSDAGLLRLGHGLESRPVNDGPFGADPCGVLLFGGTAHQGARQIFDEGGGHFAVAAFERSFEAFGVARPFLGRFDRSGAWLMGEGLAFPARPGAMGEGVAAAPDGAGGYFIVWENDAPPLDHWADVVVRRVDADGVPLWAEPARLSLEPTASALSLAVIDDGRGGAWVAWEEARDRLTSDPTRSYVQHVTADGSHTCGPGGIRLLDLPAANFPAALVAAGPDVIVVLGQGGTIRAIRVSPDGAMPWSPGGIPIGAWTPGWILDDVRTLDLGDGSFYVFWHEASLLAGVGSRMRVRRMRKDGTFAWPAEVIALEHSDNFISTSTALLPGGELAMAGGSLGYAPTYNDITGQVIDRRGRLRTPSTGVPVCRAPYSERSPVVFAPSLPPGPDHAAPLESVQALFIWSDQRPLLGDGFYVQAITFTSRPRLDAPATVPEILQGESITLELRGDDLAAGAAVETDGGLAVEKVTVTPIDPDGPGDTIAVTLRAVGAGPHGRAIVNPDGMRVAFPEVLRVRLDPRRIDLDESGRVDGWDVAVLAAAFGRSLGEPAYSSAADIDGDGLVDGVDLAFIAGRFGHAPVD